MTLKDLLAEPDSEEALFDVNQRWLDAALVPMQIPFLEHLSLIEKKYLITHLVYSQQAWFMLPAGSADSIFPVIADAAEPYNPLLRKLVCMSEATAGIQTAKWMETALEGLIDFQRSESVHLRILWKVFGPRAIRLTARRWSALHKSETVWAERDFEAMRLLTGISKRTWDLLLQLQPNPPVFERWMNAGIAIPVREWRLLLEYSPHAPLLQGLVFWAETRTFFDAANLPVDADQLLAIAHPSAFTSESLRNEWKSRLQANGSFDQFRTLTPTFNPIGLHAQPTQLFLHLESQDWVRGSASRADGCIRTHTKTFPDIAVTAEIEYCDGVPTRPGGRWKPQTIRAYRFFRQSHSLEIATNEVHPIALATVMADLAPLQKS